MIRDRLLYEHTPAMLHAIDAEGRFVAVSNYWLEVMGYAREEVIGRLSLDFLTAESRHQAQTLYLPRFWQAGRIRDVHYQMVKGDGSLIDISLSAETVYDDNGQILHSLAVLTDITQQMQAERELVAYQARLERLVSDRTAELQRANQHLQQEVQERIQAEQQLRASEERFRLIVETIEDIFWVDDIRTGRALYTSPAFEKVWGFSPTQIEDNLSRLLDYVHPDDRPQVVRSLEAEFVYTQAFEVDYRICRPDGTMRWVREHGFPIADENGAIHQMVGITFDVTSLKQAESQLRQYERIISATPDRICLIDRHYRYRIANEAYRVWQRLEDRPLIGCALVDVVGNDVFEHRLRPRLDRALAGETLQFEEWAESWGRDPQFVSVRYTPYLEPDGTCSGVVVSSRDLTSLQQTRSQLQAALDQLQSHIDNSPLAVIEWDSQLRVKRWTGRAEAIFGWRAEAVLGKHLTAFPLTPTTAIDQTQSMVQQLTDPAVKQLITLVRHGTQSGEMGYSEWYNSKVKDAEGNLVSVLSLVQDVTARQQAQADLHRYARLVADTRDAICVVDRDYRYQLANRTYLDWHRTTAADLLGRTASEHLGPAVMAVIRPLIERCLAGEVVQHEGWFTYAGIGRRFRSVTYSPYREADGQISGVVVSVRDLTALQQAEERQRELLEILEATSDCVGMATPEGQITYLNGATQRLLELSAADLAAMGHVRQFYPEWALQMLRQEALPAALAHGTWQGESALLRPDGTEIPVSQTLAVHYRADGELKSISTIVRDIRDRKRIERQLQARLCFERLISRLSTYFVDLPEDALEAAMQQALQEIGRSTQAERSYVVLFAADGQTSHLVCQWYAPHLTPLPESAYSLAVAAYPWWMGRLQQRQAIVLSDPADVPPEAEAERQAMDAAGTRSLVAVPMTHNQTLIGYIGFATTTRAKIWTADEIALLKLVGDLFANAHRRQQVETALRHQEHYFRALTEQAYDIVVLLDAQGRFQYVTPSAQRVLGYTPAALQGRAAETFVAPADVPVIQDVLKQAAAAPAVSQPLVEYRVRHCNGSWRTFEATTTSLLHDPIVGGIVVNCRDVTDRKQAQLERWRSEQQFRAIFEQTAISMAQIALDGTYLQVNPAFCKLVGYRAEDLIGQHFERFTHPDDLEQDRQLTAEVARGQVATHAIDKRFVRSDGEVRQVQVVMTAVCNERGNPTFLVSVYNDVTARLAAEQALRSVVEGTAAVTGADFFPALAENLAAALAVDHVLINEVVGDRLRVLAAHSIRPHAIAQHYPMAANPCAHTLASGVYCCPSGVSEVFPEDDDLLAMGAESYLGVAMVTSQHQTIGEICVLHSQPLRAPDRAIAILRTFAARATAELERQRSNQALRASEAMNRAMIEALPDLLVRVRRDGLCLDIHCPEHFPLYLPVDQQVGRYQQDYLPADVSGPRQAAIARALMTGEPQMYEYSLWVDQELRWEESRIVPLQADEALVLVRDTTERKRAEQEVRRLNQALEAHNQHLEALVEQRTAELLTFMNALPDYIFVVERESMRMPFCNEKLASVTLQGRRRDVEGKTLFECFSPEQAAYFVEQNRQVFESGETLHLKEQLNLPNDDLHLDTYKIPLKRSDGEVYALIGTSRDITELVKAQQAIAQQAEQLAATNQELESFSYSVSHDLRAPLRHINGFITALRQHLTTVMEPDAKVEHYLSVIANSSQKMGALIDGLLTLSRVGRREMTRQPVALNGLVEQALSLLHVSRNDPQRQIEIEIGELPTVSGDARLLQQVFMNLLDNAVKFSRDRTPARITIGCTPTGAIYVRDNGVGFDMAYADKLFGPFQRLHGQREFQGTGIGLAIVQRIIHRHGGHIWIDSAPDAGTTVCFTLPAEADAAANTAAASLQ